MRQIKKLACILTLIFSGASHGSEAETNNSAWKFTIAPYIWAINMNGSVTTGDHRAHVAESFSEILQHLNFAGMLWLDMTKDKVGIFLNTIYTVLRYNTSDDIASLHVKTRYGLLSGGVSYEVYKKYYDNDLAIAFHPYAGFRYTENDVTLNLDAGPISLTAVNNQYWTDPIIGARLNIDFSKSWSAVLAADIGGINASRQYSYNAIALLDYSPQPATSFYLGYRLLSQHYATSSSTQYYNWNMRLFGPVIGVAINF